METTVEPKDIVTGKVRSIIDAVRRDFGGYVTIDMLYDVCNVEFVNPKRTWSDVRLRGIIGEDGWSSFILMRDGKCEPIEIPYK
jgi:hypothetical protein